MMDFKNARELLELCSENQCPISAVKTNLGHFIFFSQHLYLQMIQLLMVSS